MVGERGDAPANPPEQQLAGIADLHDLGPEDRKVGGRGTHTAVAA